MTNDNYDIYQTDYIHHNHLIELLENLDDDISLSLIANGSGIAQFQLSISYNVLDDDISLHDYDLEVIYQYQDFK